MARSIADMISEDRARLERAVAAFWEAYKRWDPFGPEGLEAVDRARREMNRIEARLSVTKAVGMLEEFERRFLE